MADIKSLLSSPSFMDVAYQDAYQGELNSQLVQQKIKQLQEEAMYKSLMQPYEIDAKQANVEYMRAMAEKMKREPQELNAERIAKAEQMKRIGQGRDARGLLETAMAMPEGRNEFLTRLVQQGKLRPDVLQRLAPDEKTYMFTDENINRIIQGLREEDPELSKIVREDTRGGYMLQKQQAADEAAKERLGMSLRAKKELQDAKIQGDLSKVGNDPVKLAGEYQRIAEELERAGNTEEADIYFAMARRASLLKAMSIPSAGQQKVDVGAMGVQTTTPVGATANQPQRTVKIKRDAAGNLVRE